MTRAPAPRDVPLVALPDFGPDAPARLAASRVLLVGAGGLGCPIAQYLVAAGIGALTLVDFDTVAAGNLGRQVLYSPKDVGQRKVDVARASLARQNPNVAITVRPERADAASLPGLLEDVDLAIDASDNFGTRLAMNDACLAAGQDWIMGAATRSEGQFVFLPASDARAPCYRCIYGEAADVLEDCAGGGVLGPVTGLVGSAVAALALQVLAGQVPRPALHLVDANGWEWRSLGVSRRVDCTACGGR
ncbi:MAG: HesA/MoeB/ThiF family protein [Pseudomonadota bacterium]